MEPGGSWMIKKSNKRYHYEQHHHVDEPSGNEVQHTSLPQRVRQLCHKIRKKGEGMGMSMGEFPHPWTMVARPPGN